MDQHSNQARQTDEYGNPIRQPGGPNLGVQQGTGYGTTGARKTHGGTAPGTFDTGLAGQQQGQGQLRRSGSSSSSSSEDDGMGGRRKKGLKDRVKDKLPGGHKKDDQCGGTHETTAQGLGGGYGYGEGQQQQEKKGMMDKIKDKLPGAGGR